MLIQPSLDSCLARVIDFFDGYNFVKLTSNYQKKKIVISVPEKWYKSNRYENMTQK